MNKLIVSDQENPRDFPPLGQNIKALIVWPEFPSSFWGFQNILQIIGQKAVMAPLGPITLAALCPKTWQVKMIDQAVEALRDHDILWADVVMISAMYVQGDSVLEVLKRARHLGKRTMIGGPFASSIPEMFLGIADHIVVGEPDEVFDQIAKDLENGRAKRMYEVTEKPDVTHTPMPRFDLLKLDRYASMPIQFSRGCPFQCEFCDIITLYGRKPRTKQTQQVLDELETLYQLGWRKEIFIVDDNFIGNRRRALELVTELVDWQQSHDYPFAFYTEASLDLAQQPQLLAMMVKANFFYVFIGIESPSQKSLAETKKYQNLREDPLKAIRFIQSQGLWVTGGFIIGFDSDTEAIFEQQVKFIEAAAIPWAMMGFLQAPPTTPLFDRMGKEGRLILDSKATSNFSLPNFHTKLPLPILLAGFQKALTAIYTPDAFFERGFRSLWHWKPRSYQKAPHFSAWGKAAIVMRSIWYQGIASSYRSAYWIFLVRLLNYWRHNPQRLWLGFTILISGHHFISYAAEVAAQIENAIHATPREPYPSDVDATKNEPLSLR